MKENKAGWIKLYRKLLHSPIFTSEKGLKVWVWCLLKASHEGYEQYVGRSLVVLKPGQFVFGRKAAGGELRMKPTTIHMWIQILQNDSYIDIKTSNKFSVISINNWNDYQGTDTTTDIQPDNKEKTKIPSGRSSTKFDTTTDINNQTEIEETLTPKLATNGKQTDTNKNVKEINIYASRKCLTDELCEEIAAQYLVTEKAVKDLRDDLIDYCDAKAKKYSNYRAALQTWVRRSIKDRKIFKQQQFATKVPVVEQISEAERQKNIQLLAQMRKKLVGGKLSL